MRTAAYDVCGNEGIEKIEEVRDGGHDPVEKSGSWTNALALRQIFLRKEKSL